MATRAARMRSGGISKRRMPSSMTQLQVELTAHISVPRACRSRTRVSISGKRFGSMRVAKNSAAAERISLSRRPW